MDKFLVNADFFSRVNRGISDIDFVMCLGISDRDEVMDAFLSVFGSYERLVMMSHQTNIFNVNSKYDSRLSLVVDIYKDNYVISKVRTSSLIGEDNPMDDVEIDGWVALPRAVDRFVLGKVGEVDGMWSDELIDRLVIYVGEFIDEVEKRRVNSMG